MSAYYGSACALPRVRRDSAEAQGAKSPRSDLADVPFEDCRLCQHDGTHRKVIIERIDDTDAHCEARHKLCACGIDCCHRLATGCSCKKKAGVNTPLYKELGMLS